MYKEDYLQIPKELRFGLLLESQGVIPRTYRRVAKVIPDFNLVFTHSAKLLAEFPNTRWIPGGGVWVGGSHAGGEPQIYRKSKDASILSSNKMSSRLHRRRLGLAIRLQRDRGRVDVFRPPFRSTDRISVLTTLRDYRYSICIENFLDRGYFTEKILNCFATGTVPIYLGASGIGDYFDSSGVIPFRGYSDLQSRVLPLIGVEDYESRMSSIKENLERVKDFRSVEDFIYLNYFRSAS